MSQERYEDVPIYTTYNETCENDGDSGVPHAYGPLPLLLVSLKLCQFFCRGSYLGR